MLAQMIKFVSEHLNLTTIVEVITVAGALIAVYRYLLPALPGNIVNQLFDTLKNGKSVATKAEVLYQTKCYIPPKFVCENTVKTIKELQKEIQKSGSVITITGKPASGKTTTMRNLYCKLSRVRKCVYIQMNSIHDITDFRQRVREQNAQRRKPDEPVTVFIDGADEAMAFKLPEHEIGMATFCAMYLNGEASEIYNVFRECGLNLDSIVISLRPEFLERPECLEEYTDSNLRGHVYTIQKMENRDVLKIYKSLKVLRRLDKSDTVSRHQDGRYPPRLLEEWRYIRRFRKILESTTDSIFRYPMYVRYAYKFMREYWDQWNPYMENLTPESNMALSFRVLLDAIFKWEFQIYYGQKRGSRSKQKPERTGEEKRFRAAMENCLEHVVEAMPMRPGQSNPTISRERLEDILKNCAYGEHDRLVIAHCVLSSDSSGQWFSFCHSTFYEYYLAQYLLKKASYNVRKEYLTSPLSSENLRQMYYALLCHEESRRLRLQNSISNISGRGLNLASCLDLQKEAVLEIKDNPQMPVTEILSYLPFAPCFLYHGAKFTREQIEEMMDGDMDLRETRWKSLKPAPGLAPCDSVKDLDLCHLPMEDLQDLHLFTNLDCLDIRLNRTPEYIVNGALEQIRGFSLTQLYIYSYDGALCTRIQDALNCGEFHAESVFVETPEFSAAYAEIFRLKCEAEKLGQKNRFYILIRTGLQRAKKEFHKDGKHRDLPVLKAVFELEADEAGPLGLQTHESETDKDATLWVGLALAKQYIYLDSIDEDKSAYQIYNRLAPYIEKNSSELSMHFGYAFGQRLHSIDSKRAREWLKFVNQYISPNYSGIQEISVKINYFKACVRCGDKDLADLRNEIMQLIQKSPSYIKNSDYYWFLKICCAQPLEKWKKGTPPPKKLLALLQKYLDMSRDYAEKEKQFTYQFSAVYMQLVYMNRAEETDKAGALLSDLAAILPLVIQSSKERNKQAYQIQYMDQKLYFLFVSGQRERAVEAADELLEYPYRKEDIWKGSVQYIRDHCTGGDELYISADKHRLWNSLWY